MGLGRGPKETRERGRPRLELVRNLPDPPRPRACVGRGEERTPASSGLGGPKSVSRGASLDRPKETVAGGEEGEGD